MRINGAASWNLFESYERPKEHVNLDDQKKSRQNS
jgi:hypothetical protein